jgi:ABC-2 type transport system ATP-binding protein
MNAIDPSIQTTREMTTAAISLKNISKTYKHFQLRNINLELAQGEVAGLIGPNGAGKSTTMRILMGLVNPEQGSVSVLGQPISSREADAKKEIGYFSDDMRLYKRETISWHMQFVKSVYPQWDDDYARELIQRFGLLEGQVVKGLSHGQRVKAMLLLVLARRPKLLILDEPTNGLDPVAKHEVISELMRVVEDENRTILYSSHNTQDIEQICDTITFIDRGQVIASQNRDDFLDTWKRIRLHVTEAWIDPKIPGTRVESSFRSQRVLSTNQYRDDLTQRLLDSGATIETIEPMSLEEIFVSVVMRGREENPS